MITARHIFLSFARQHRGGMAVVFIAGLLARATGLLIPLAIGRYLALHFGYASFRANLLADVPGHWLANGNTFAAALIGLVGIWSLFRYIERYQTSVLGEYLVQSLRESLFDRQLQASPAAFTQRTTGKYLLRYSGDLKSIQNLFNLGIMAFVRDLIAVVPAALLFAYLLPDMALPALSAFLLLLLPLLFLNRHLYRASVMRRDRRSFLLAFVSERLLRHSAIQVLNRSKLESKKFRKRSVKLAAAGKQYFKVESLVRTLIPALVYLVPGFLFLWMEWRGSETTDPESLSLAALLLIGVAPLFRRLARVTVHWELGKLSMRKLLVVMNQEAAEASGKPDLELVEGKVECRELGFHLENGEPLLEDVNLELPENGMTWLQGGTGSGKTVLVKLFLGVLEANAGEILVDGQDIRACNLKSVRKRMAVVSDAWPLLGKTVFEAVSYSRKPEKRERAGRMLEKLQSALPEGVRLQLDDPIGDMGSNLSGGHTTLLQFVRAFLTRKPILLLDEPFRHLDEAQMALLAKMLNRLRPKRNILVLSGSPPPESLEIDQHVFLKPPNHNTFILRNMG